ncbi:DUF2630 family protein [Catenuloplanes japonicus]|uniref:DUF2630 family protein n=1 Tax=Catenuloplanes japonicus TaxID=33876 RepID=UPI000525E653|nr:DUF2630 family protein [Catenuloplanes japonicus]
MEDTSILSQINDLVDEEHKLRTQLASGEITATEEHERLRAVEVSLDQCWDLLRRRRAAREFGQDPEAVEVRSGEQVEGYIS